ncbi:MAG: RluA family pseudouridine synthase [Saprospiraceae bacterium]|nr:RluA family pseudouridine synthase [Saprospiraceae bacterium]
MSRRQKFEIINSDDHLLVVNKPAGLLSIPGRDPSEMSLYAELARQTNQLYIVHRLDRDTSGVIVFARTAQAHKDLSGQFAERTVTKRYQALVVGHVHPIEQTIDAPLHITAGGRVTPRSSGKPSRTDIRVLEQFNGYCLVEAIPRTGRQHQIRVHLQVAGHPLVIDPLYAQSEPLTILDIKPHAHVRDEAEVRPILARTPLHSESLQFTHPDGTTVTYSAKWPRDLRAAVNQLRKWRR